MEISEIIQSSVSKNHNEGNVETPLILDRIIEDKYTRQNPQVLEQIEVFYKLANVPEIFSKISNVIPFYPLRASKIVGPAWHEFSEIMPWVLCSLAAKVDTNYVRHYIIQGAFEELGGRNCSDIHPDQFLDALKVAGLNDSDVSEYRKKYHNRQSIKHLRDNVEQLSETPEILGFGLGLELPAVENIETVFRALTPSPYYEEKVEKTTFFKIHRVIEEEHIRLHTSNFLRFCTSEDMRKLFYKGFNSAIQFWNIFWSELVSFLKHDEQH